MSSTSASSSPSLTCQLGLQLVKLGSVPLGFLQGSVELGAKVHLLLLVAGQLQLKPGDLGRSRCQFLSNLNLRRERRSIRGKKKQRKKSWKSFLQKKKKEGIEAQVTGEEIPPESEIM